MSDKQQGPSPEDVRAEYAALVQYHNSIVTHRFTLVGLFIAAVGILASRGMGRREGMLVIGLAIATFIVERRNRVLYSQMSMRAMEIEKTHWNFNRSDPDDKTLSLFSRMWLTNLPVEVKCKLSADLKKELIKSDKWWKFRRLTASHSSGLNFLYVLIVLYALFSIIPIGGNPMVAWLNSNQGFVMALLTLVYIVTTLFIVILMLRANSISKKGLEQAVDLERLRSRPYLLFDLEPRNGAICAVLKNLGKTAAYNVTTAITPELKRAINGRDWESSLTSHQIPLVAPDREISDVIQPGSDFVRSYPELKFEGILTYTDFSGSPFKEKFNIDLNYQNKLLCVSDESSEVPKKLEEIRKSIDSISKKIGRGEA